MDGKRKVAGIAVVPGTNLPGKRLKQKTRMSELLACREMLWVLRIIFFWFKRVIPEGAWFDMNGLIFYT